MTACSGTIGNDSSPHASLGNDEADQAGTCFFEPSFLSYPELYDQLVSRGLDFGCRNRTESENLLRIYGYYHLRGYWMTFEAEKGFCSGATFDQVLDIVRLDEELAEFVLSAATPIELALRSALSQTLAKRSGPFALENSKLFKDGESYCCMVKSLEREQRQGRANKATYVLRNLKKYGRLPVWAAIELTSLGTTSKMFGNLAEATLASEVSETFGVRPRYLKNWLRCLTAIRNMSAHHDRLYNRMFPTLPALYKEHAGIDRSRLFPQIIILLRLHDAVRPNESGAIRLQLSKIMDAHKNVDLGPIGFPKNWREVLGIPAEPSTGSRARGRQGGRPPKDANAIEEALFLYDMKTDTIAEICRKTGVGPTTLYKYINLRKDAQ